MDVVIVKDFGPLLNMAAEVTELENQRQKAVASVAKNQAGMTALATYMME